MDKRLEKFCAAHALSGRQAEIVRMALQGCNRKATAAEIGCSVKTVEGYWRRIYEKTGAGSEREVVSMFILMTDAATDDPG